MRVAAALSALLITPACMPAQVAANGDQLTVTTANAVATFRGPDLAGFTNSLTGESYLRLPATSPLSSLVTLGGSASTLRSSGWTKGADSGTATLTESDSIRTYTITVSVDAASQEIVVRVGGQSSTPGLRYCSWYLAGLDLNSGRLAVPTDTGVYFDAAHRGVGTSIEYPSRWGAQMMVYEAARGAMLVYANDAKSLFKQLTISARDSSTIDVGLRTHAYTPWASATGVPVVEWRLKALAGDWRTAAKVYADWLAANRPPALDSSRAWVRDIRTVVRLDKIDPALLDQLAARLTPSKTLVYLPVWRNYSYDVNYPDYTPGPGVASLIAHAHTLGFRVMVHANGFGVSPMNPDYAAVRPFQMKDPNTQQPQGWLWDNPPSTPNRFAYINPASSAYRKLLVARLRSAVDSVHPDAIHLDQMGGGWDDDNGSIEGMTEIEGIIQLHRDLLAAFPGVALGSEAMNDVIANFQSFAQSWWGDLPSTPLPHPLAEFLFGGQLLYYGHLAQPLARQPEYADYLRYSEPRAVLPNLFVQGTADLDLSNTDVARAVRVAQSWQANGFQPDWQADWTGAVVRFRGANGSTAALTDSGTLVALQDSGSVLYQRLHNTNQQDTLAYIPNWPAFDAAKLYGLDPATQYWLEQVTRPLGTHISFLPEGVKVGPDTLMRPGFAMVDLVGTQAVISVTVTPAAGSAAPTLGADGNLSVSGGTAVVSGVPVPGQFALLLGPGSPVASGTVLAALPLDVSSGTYGQLVLPGSPYGGVGKIGSPTAGGVTSNQAISARPPISGRTVLSWTLRLPDNPGLQLSWRFGLDDGGLSTTALNFSVRINGAPYWHSATTATGWIPASLDLSAWRGRSILLQLVTESTAANIYDHAWWDAPTISIPSTPCAFTIPSGAQIGFRGGGSTIPIQTAGGCPWWAAASAPWISITPVNSGSGTGAVSYTVAPNYGGARTATITIAGQTFTIGQDSFAGPVVQAIFDSWNYVAGVAPGTWVTISGTNLAAGAGPAQGFSSRLAGVNVTFNGTAAALYYVSDTQINALAPASAAPGPVQVVVTANGTSSAPFSITATATRPAVYAPPNAAGSTFFVTAALQGTGILVGNSASDPRVARPVYPGDILDLYMIGLGATADPSKFFTDRAFSGAFPLAATVTANVGGKNAPVQFAGLTSPGLYLVRIAIPADLGAGPQAIQISAGGQQTRPALVLMVGVVPDP